MKCFIILNLLLISTVVNAKTIACQFSGKKWEIKVENTETIDIIEKKDNIKYHYHIENINSFSPENDYVVLDNNQHTVTYPLICEVL